MQFCAYDMDTFHEGDIRFWEITISVNGENRFSVLITTPNKTIIFL